MTSREKEIKKMEELGLDVLETNGKGQIVYQTKKEEDKKFCNSCPHLRLLPDPDPFDWFASFDVKAICSITHQEIAVALNVWEASRVDIPADCLLGKDD